MCLEDVSQLRFGCAVGQIPNVKVLHCNSSFSESSRLVGVAVDFDGRPSESRGGAGRARIAWVRAMEAERTAEIRLEASKMPQRCVKSPRSGEDATFKSPTTALSAFFTGVWLSALGESARYSGWPTRNANRCGGVALRTSSQNLSRWPCSSFILIKTRSYKAALHHMRASAISETQSTSTPNFLMTSARNSR